MTDTEIEQTLYTQQNLLEKEKRKLYLLHAHLAKWKQLLKKCQSIKETSEANLILTWLENA